MKSTRTMQAIADKMGVSRRTVSSVLNNKARERGISAGLEARVREFLAQAGYVPSRHARRLREGRRGVIGILYGGHLYSHLTEAFNALVSYVNTLSRQVEMMVVKPDNMIEGLREMVARGVTSLVWVQAASYETERAATEAYLAYLSNFETTVVYNHRFDRPEWDETLTKRGIHVMGVDREAGFFMLGKALRRLGHRVVLVPNEEGTSTTMRAAPGLRRAGLTVVCGRPNDLRYERTAGYGEALAGYIESSIATHRATAVCFLDDEIAGFAMAALLQRGVRIPRDLTVTGFDGMSYASALAVPLTTLSVPVEDMVKRVKEILEKTRRKATATYRHCFPLRLVLRESHARARMGEKTREIIREIR